MPHVEEIVGRVRRELPRLIEQYIAAPSHTFRDIVTGVAEDLRGLPHDERRPNNIAHYLSQHPQELAALEQRLGAARPFGFQNIGDRALVLTFDNEHGQRQILRLTRHAEPAIPNSQSFHAGQSIMFNGTHISVTQPAIPLETLIESGVITPPEADLINARMKVEVARDGLVYNDVLPGNTAITSHGHVIVTDVGALATEAAERIRIPHHFHDSPDNARYFLRQIDANKQLAATLRPLNADMRPPVQSYELLAAFLESHEPQRGKIIPSPPSSGTQGAAPA